MRNINKITTVETIILLNKKSLKYLTLEFLFFHSHTCDGQHSSPLKSLPGFYQKGLKFHEKFACFRNKSKQIEEKLWIIAIIKIRFINLIYS